MTNKIFTIKELREKARLIIEIPDFDGKGTINVRVQRPRLMAMAAQGKIPNHLLGIATEVVGGKKKQDKTDENFVKDAALMMELYAQACLVEPTYEEFKEIMTDEQSDMIFRWAMGQVNTLDSFREEQGDSSDNDISEELPKVTKRDTKDKK